MPLSVWAPPDRELEADERECIAADTGEEVVYHSGSREWKAHGCILFVCDVCGRSITIATATGWDRIAPSPQA